MLQASGNENFWNLVGKIQEFAHVSKRIFYLPLKGYERSLIRSTVLSYLPLRLLENKRSRSRLLL
jgi:hypothetical protein